MVLNGVNYPVMLICPMPHYPKYIKILQDKAIVKYYNKKYFLEDLMLETWLNHEKEITGVYPS